MFFISLCADRTIANITLGASLNCQQPFRGLLCRSTLRQGRDEARDHESHSNDANRAHVSDAHFLTSFGTDVRETRSRPTMSRKRPFWQNFLLSANRGRVGLRSNVSFESLRARTEIQRCAHGLGEGIPPFIPGDSW